MTPRPQRDRLAPLDAALREIEGRPLSLRERDAFGRYLDVLMQWNRTHDLTACRTEADVVTSLFRDSLLFLRVIDSVTERRELRILDIGPGAGVPGLPIRLVRPAVYLVMIESRRKRASFLRAVQRHLPVDRLDVIEGRAEVLVGQIVDNAGYFDLVLGRGIEVRDLLTWAWPYLADEGAVVAGGPPRVADIPRSSGYSGVEWRTERFPGIGVSRTFLVARKSKAG